MARNHSSNHRGPSAFPDQTAIPNYAKRKTRNIDTSPPITHVVISWQRACRLSNGSDSFVFRYVPINELSCTQRGALEHWRHN